MNRPRVKTFNLRERTKSLWPPADERGYWNNLSRIETNPKPSLVNLPFSTFNLERTKHGSLAFTMKHFRSFVHQSLSGLKRFWRKRMLSMNSEKARPATFLSKLSSWSFRVVRFTKTRNAKFSSSIHNRHTKTFGFNSVPYFGWKPASSAPSGKKANRSKLIWTCLKFEQKFI